MLCWRFPALYNIGSHLPFTMFTFPSVCNYGWAVGIKVGEGKPRDRLEGVLDWMFTSCSHSVSVSALCLLNCYGELPGQLLSSALVAVSNCPWHIGLEVVPGTCSCVHYQIFCLGITRPTLCRSQLKWDRNTVNIGRNIHQLHRSSGTARSNTVDCHVSVWLQPSDELSPFFSTTESFYPASYYFNRGQLNRGMGYPTGTNDGQPAWRGS